MDENNPPIGVLWNNISCFRDAAKPLGIHYTIKTLDNRAHFVFVGGHPDISLEIIVYLNRLLLVDGCNIIREYIPFNKYHINLILDDLIHYEKN